MSFYSVMAPPTPRSPMTGYAPLSIVGYQGPFAIVGNEPTLKDDPMGWMKANWQYPVGGALILGGIAAYMMSSRR